MSGEIKPAGDWTPPAPASDAELARHKLPCDVQVGRVVLRAGVSLGTLVDMCRRFYGRVYEGKDPLE